MIITSQTEIQAPIEVVFSYLEDNDKQKEWMTGLAGKTVSGKILSIFFRKFQSLRYC